MNLKVRTECDHVNWQEVADTLKTVGMAFHDAAVHQRAFEASHTRVFVYDGDALVAFGRALSDGEYQGALYDIAVLPEYQGKHIGKLITETIMESLPNCTLILYAAPGMEGFYERLGFRSLKTGMGYFTSPQAFAKFT